MDNVDTNETEQTTDSTIVKIQEQEASEGLRVLTSPTINVSDEAVEQTEELQDQENESTNIDEEIKWFYADGIEGTGEKPEWFNDKTFKNLSEQAKAHGELRKKLAGFTGAPKDGYEIQLEEEVSDIELDEDDPILKHFADIAYGLNMSQEGFNQTVNGFLKKSKELQEKQIEQEEQESKNHWEEQLKTLGPKADEKLKVLEQTGKNIFSDSEELLEAFNSSIKNTNQMQVYQRFLDKMVPTQIKHVDSGSTITREMVRERMEDPRFLRDIGFQKDTDAMAHILYGSGKK